MESGKRRLLLASVGNAVFAYAVLLSLIVATAANLGAAPDSGVERIFFSKSFPRSVPEYFEVTVDSTGKASYREDPQDEDPLEFTLSEAEVHEVFELAGKLAHFQKSLQADRKVAFTGTKTLRYSSGAGNASETQFTYSTDSDAQAIVAWFEKAGETERYRIELERAIQFDRLGVNKALLLFQASFDDGRVVGREQFIPVLKTIAEQAKFMHMARARAQSLLERIGSQTP